MQRARERFLALRTSAYRFTRFQENVILETRVTPALILLPVPSLFDVGAGENYRFALLRKLPLSLEATSPCLDLE